MFEIRIGFLDSQVFSPRLVQAIRRGHTCQCFDVGSMGLEDTHLGVWENSLSRDLSLMVLVGVPVYSFPDLRGTGRCLLSCYPGGIFWDNGVGGRITLLALL